MQVCKGVHASLHAPCMLSALSVQACTRSHGETLLAPLSATLQAKRSTLPITFSARAKSTQPRCVSARAAERLAMSSLCKTLPSALRLAEVMNEPYEARGSLE